MTYNCVMMRSTGTLPVLANVRTVSIAILCSSVMLPFGTTRFTARPVISSDKTFLFAKLPPSYSARSAVYLVSLDTSRVAARYVAAFRSMDLMLVAMPFVKLSMVRNPGGSEPSRSSLSKYWPRAAQPSFHAADGVSMTAGVGGLLENRRIPPTARLRACATSAGSERA
jgi:hypothetical protein